ncbi:MAG TPA: ribonuclease P protein component, partial [Myxococcota bacterium]|nr:ribonuclease P protein component [Myxococcota bacterium]
SRDFRRVMRSGRRRASQDLVVLTCRRDGRSGQGEALDSDSTRGSRRLGITASRKVGDAVRRNRFKRRVREWFRRNREELPPSLDLVVIARRSGAQLDSRELDDRLRSLLGLQRAEGRADGDGRSR